MMNLIKTMQKLHKEGIYSYFAHSTWLDFLQYRKQIETWLAAHNVPYENALLFGKLFGISIM